MDREMTNEEIAVQREIASVKGNLEDYDYHLSVVENPLPYRIWRVKFDALNLLQAIPETDQRYFDPRTAHKENMLCKELGY